MRKAKATIETAKKTLSPRIRRRASTPPLARARRVPALRKPKAASAPSNETALARAQSDVVAAKFQGDEPVPRPRPTLPLSYGESHLLLLPRDPQTLFASWDLSPSLIESLKSRLGARGFAVSTLTLRLSTEAGDPVVFHVGRKVRSRYLKVAGGVSFTAEIGFTTPTGRFEVAARSMPCSLPLGPARSTFVGAASQPSASYRAVQKLVKAASPPSTNRVPERAAVPTAPAAAPATAPAVASTSSMPVVPFRPPAAPSARRTLGGASDLYRR